MDLGLDLRRNNNEDGDSNAGSGERGEQKSKKMSDRVRHVPRSPGQLHELEVVHAVIDSYLWLATRFENEFCDIDSAHDQVQRTGCVARVTAVCE